MGSGWRSWAAGDMSVYLDFLRYHYGDLGRIRVFTTPPYVLFLPLMSPILL